jgi:hypothetical protein
MEINEIEKCMATVEEIIKEALADNQPGRISDKLIKLSAWKIRMGELVAESVKMLQESETQVDYDFSTEFVSARMSQEKKLPEQDAKSLATINIKEAKDDYNQKLWYKTRIFNLWKDLEVVIDAIKYKVNALQKEWKDTRSTEFPGGKEW